MAASLPVVNNRKYRRLSITVAVMIVLTVLQPFLWRFVHGQALTLQQQRSQGQQIANVRDRNADILQKLQASREFLSQIEIVSPPTTAKTKVVERVEQLADQMGLQMDITVIQELQTGDVAVSDDTIVPVSMSVTLTGTTEQLLGFLDRIEHTQELSLVPKWSLASASAPAALNQYTLTMDIYFFLRRVGDGE